MPLTNMFINSLIVKQLLSIWKKLDQETKTNAFLKEIAKNI